MKYSDDIIQRVRDSSDIVSVVSEYVSLKKAGSSYKGLCPFHS
ncbi:MAG TPA: CHC2 zinc finger domain-containing protein, partial [bacterium]|nr:CHC2 zinc finger domain-containing protein [bacterium]